MGRKARDTFHPLVGYIDPLFAAWLAGFIDGEGCFSIERGQNKSRKQGKLLEPHYSISLVITNSDRRSLEEIHGVLQCGRFNVQDYPGRQWRTTVQYWVNGAMAHEVAQLVLPYLRVKRVQAELFLEFYTCGTEEVNEHRARLFYRMRELNAKGPRPD